MKFVLKELVVGCKREREVITFTDSNYFFGQMGAGKSTLARLIDFCLGGTLELTPALQSEFVYAALTVEIEGRSLLIKRDVDSNNVTASYSDESGDVVVNVPSRAAVGVVIPGTQVEVLSDLIFMLAGKTPPMVRKSKLKEDSELSRLSLRDLLWFCYLDQETIDSDFFHLGADGDTFKKLKSRDVLRFVVGFHQEKVSELESDLADARFQRMASASAAESMAKAMAAANIATLIELEAARRSLKAEGERIAQEISAVRHEKRPEQPHAIETLQAEGRLLSESLKDANRAVLEIEDERSKHLAHRNELTSLSARWLRSLTARVVIEGIEFVKCPRCTLPLPQHQQEECPVCGQVHSEAVSQESDEAAERDLQSRIAELDDIIDDQDKQLAATNRYLAGLQLKKRTLDTALSTATREYDSSYLSAVLDLERKHASVLQQLVDLEKLEQLAAKILELQAKAETYLKKEASIRAELKLARAAAEKDTGNLNRLKQLFLDCLIRSKIAGFATDDIVEIRGPHFLPEVTPKHDGDLAVTSFANIGSGGKKTLFKCCFALAIHRLVHETGGLLPELLIIDSPMKNISERENIEQFKGFHEMLYELSTGELLGTQFILIDKEMLPPPADYSVSFQARHMTPENANHPPLIRYYVGK